MTVMLVLLLLLAALAVAALAAGAWRDRRLRGRTADGGGAPEETRTPPAECCGQHEVCERESLLAAVSRKVEYYDDEELDRFRGRPSGAYTEEEIEEFREVMYTCREEEVAGWSRSLQLRGVELPDELKDELFLIVRERRER